MSIVKGFYIYVEEDTCFDCGRSDRNVLGWYKGEPDKETLTKIAKSYIEKGVIPYEESQLTVCAGRIIAEKTLYEGPHKVFSVQTMYETEKFVLNEVE